MIFAKLFSDGENQVLVTLNPDNENSTFSIKVRTDTSEASYEVDIPFYKEQNAKEYFDSINDKEAVELRERIIYAALG